MNRRETIALWLILGAGFLLKGIYLFGGMENPESISALSIDSLYHYNWAVLISNGDLLANSPYFRAPLYPFILGGIFKISGSSLLFARIVQLLGGCVTLFFIFKISLKLSDYKGALVACLLYLLYPISTYFEAELLLDSLFVLFSLASFYYLYSGKSNIQRSVVGGLFFGLAAITRPTILVFVIPVIAYFFKRSEDLHPQKDSLINCIRFLLVLMLTIAPIAVVNFLGSGQLIPISYQGGINFYIGNNNNADGLTAALPPVGTDWTLDDASWLQYQETGQSLEYGEQSTFWLGKTLGEISENPGHFLSLLLKKSFYLIAGQEVSNNRPLHEAVFGNRFLHLFPIRFPILLSLAMIPFMVGAELRRKMYPILLVMVIYGLTLTLFFISSRFRLPLISFLAIAGGIGLATVIGRIKEKQFLSRLPFILGGMLLLFFLSNMNIYKSDVINLHQAQFLKANQALRTGSYAKAAHLFEELKATDPGYKNAALNAGFAYLKMGQADRAMSNFQNELLSHPKSADALGNIASLFYLEGHYDSALVYYGKALEHRPYHIISALGYLRTMAATDDPTQDGNRESLRRRIRGYLQNNSAYLFEEGVYFSSKKRYGEAINNHLKVLEQLRRLRTKVPFESIYSHVRSTDPIWLLAQTNYQLGFLYGLTSDYHQSISFSRKAIEVNQDLKEAYVNMRSGYFMIGDRLRADSIAQIINERWPQSLITP